MLQVLFINIVKPIKIGTVDIDDGHNLPRVPLARDDGDHDLALAVSVAGDVTRELLDVRDELRRLSRGRCTTHASAEGDGLARHLALERAEDELWVCRLLGI